LFLPSSLPPAKESRPFLTPPPLRWDPTSKLLAMTTGRPSVATATVYASVFFGSFLQHGDTSGLATSRREIYKSSNSISTRFNPANMTCCCCSPAKIIHRMEELAASFSRGRAFFLTDNCFPSPPVSRRPRRQRLTCLSLCGARQPR
jgi:hypothetical protein